MKTLFSFMTRRGLVLILIILTGTFAFRHGNWTCKSSSAFKIDPFDRVWCGWHVSCELPGTHARAKFILKPQKNLAEYLVAVSSRISLMN
jgi:hypothetical protein